MIDLIGVRTFWLCSKLSTATIFHIGFYALCIVAFLFVNIVKVSVFVGNKRFISLLVLLAWAARAVTEGHVRITNIGIIRL